MPVGTTCCIAESTGPSHTSPSAVGHQEQHERDHERGRGDCADEKRHGRNECNRRDERVGPPARSPEAIREPAAEPDARDAADQQDGAVVNRSLDQRHAVAAHEERWQPEEQSIAHHRRSRRSERNAPERALGEQHAHDFAQAGRAACATRAVEAPALRLAHHPLEQRARSTMPAMPTTMKAVRQSTQCAMKPPKTMPSALPIGIPKRIDAERARALVRREIVGDQRIGRSHAARLADAHPEPGEKQLPEVLREAACRRQRAPEHERHRHDGRAIAAVGKHRDRDAERRYRTARTRVRPSSPAACR